MGIRQSKKRSKTYDITPVISNTEENAQHLTNINEHEAKDQQQIQATSQIEEPCEKNISTPQIESQDPRIPAWINEQNFKILLTILYLNFKEILTFKASPAVATGENYATLIVRVTISIKLQDDTIKNLSYMLKVAHDCKEMQAMMQTMNFFLVENSVYADVLPAMEDMYRQAGVNISFGPKSHQLPMDEKKIHYVLLDDLGLMGYKNANRLECLDMEHTLMVLRKLAQFHAASACHVAKNGKYSELFSPDFGSEQARTMMGQMFMSFKKPFMDNLKTYENGEKYYDAMDNFINNLVDEFVFGRKAQPGFFNVLNHGDAWSNNILFKYNDDGKLEDARLIDFQNTNWGSPAQDIFYFLISSVQIDIKLSHYDYFVRYYHQHLTENLNLLKYPLEVPSLREFHIQLMTYGSWATQTSLFAMGIVLLEPTNNATIENFLGDSQQGVDLKNSVYSGQRYRKYITEILPWLYNRGFMEVQKTELDETLSNAKLVQPTAEVISASVEQNFEKTSSPYPEWLNESLFVDVIRADFENYQKILKFFVSPATSAGDNYSSIMLKVDIDIELADNCCHNLSYMLKIPPSGEQAKALISMMNSFEKEILAYGEIIPQFEKLYKEQAGIDIVFGPESYKLNKEIECDTIVLENLQLRGFKNCQRLDGLDMQHTEATLKKLAQFHAASAYMFETKGKFPNVFERTMFTDETKDMNEDMMAAFGKVFMECVEQYKNNEEYVNKVRSYMDNSATHMIQAHKIDWSKFNVLCHGDCWTNNIMFQYDDKGKISNTLFVDFQMLRYCSPAFDLYYFLLSSPKLELKLEQFDYFIRYYHECLKHHLELLKYPNEIPTLKQLHMDLLDNGTFAMYSISGIMSVVLLDPTHTANFENMMSNEKEGIDLKKQMFLNKRYCAHAEAIYPWLNRRGLINDQLDVGTKSITDNTCNVPSWVDAEHFEDILKEHLENFEKILNISTTPATKSGDNYASSILRVKVEVQLNDGTTTTISYILKLVLESFAGFSSMWHMFEKEILMYSKYLKEFKKMYHDVGKDYVFGPEYYNFKKNVAEDVILMEDLSQSNFKCIDRREGLNMEHTKCALRKLAQFHAVSAKYFELNGPYPQIYHKGMHNEESREMFEEMKIDLAVYFKQYEGFEEYKEKLPYLMDNFIDLNIRAGAIDPTEFNVLNHGDCWLNNIMFKHNENGQVEETYYVDFQVCKYGSPALDLWFFLISSTELAIKVDCFDYFIKYYHDNLMENLQLLNYTGKIPTLRELHILMLKYGFIGFSAFSGVGALCLMESSDNATIDNYSAQTPEGEAFRNSLYLNEKFKANAAIVLPWLARRGCLD